MGSRLTLHSTNSNSDNIRKPCVAPGSSSVGAHGAASTSDVSHSREPQTNPSGGGHLPKKKYVKGIGPQRDNSLQIQLSNNHIFQRQQQRLYAQSVDDPNEVTTFHREVRGLRLNPNHSHITITHTMLSE